MVPPDGIEPHSLSSGVTAPTTSQSGVSRQNLEEGQGFEPWNAGIKTQCVRPLRHPSMCLKIPTLSLYVKCKKALRTGLSLVGLMFGSNPYLRRDERPSHYWVLLSINTAYWDSPGTQSQTPFTAKQWPLAFCSSRAASLSHSPHQFCICQRHLKRLALHTFVGLL